MKAGKRGKRGFELEGEWDSLENPESHLPPFGEHVQFPAEHSGTELCWSPHCCTSASFFCCGLRRRTIGSKPDLENEPKVTKGTSGPSSFSSHGWNPSRTNVIHATQSPSHCKWRDCSRGTLITPITYLYLHAICSWHPTPRALR